MCLSQIWSPRKGLITASYLSDDPRPLLSLPSQCSNTRTESLTDGHTKMSGFVALLGSSMRRGNRRWTMGHSSPPRPLVLASWCAAKMACETNTERIVARKSPGSAFGHGHCEIDERFWQLRRL